MDAYLMFILCIIFKEELILLGFCLIFKRRWWSKKIQSSWRRR